MSYVVSAQGTYGGQFISPFRSAPSPCCHERPVASFTYLLRGFLKYFRWSKPEPTTIELPFECIEPANRDGFYYAVARVSDSPYYLTGGLGLAPLGYFRDRPIIGNRTAIDGGIFLGAKSHEAIVINSSSGALNLVYEELLDRALRTSPSHKLFKSALLTQVQKLVPEILREDSEHLKNFIEQGLLANDKKIGLDYFVGKRMGLARHRVILGAYLLERLIKADKIKGCFEIIYPADNPELISLKYVNSKGREVLLEL